MGDGGAVLILGPSSAVNDEVIRPLRDLAMSSMEADLADFFQACKAGDKEDQRKKVQESADILTRCVIFRGIASGPLTTRLSF